MEAQVDSEVSPQKLNNFQVISPPPRFSLETLLRLSQRKHFLKREAEFIYYCLILQHFPPFNDSLLKIYSDSENFPFDRNFFLFSTSFFPELKLFSFLLRDHGAVMRCDEFFCFRYCVRRKTSHQMKMNKHRLVTCNDNYKCKYELLLLKLLIRLLFLSSCSLNKN